MLYDFLPRNICDYFQEGVQNKGDSLERPEPGLQRGSFHVQVILPTPTLLIAWDQFQLMVQVGITILYPLPHAGTVLS